MGDKDVRTKPFFDCIRSIGYQPFVQIGIQSGESTDFVICHTQQELAKFAEMLDALPLLRASPFLAGLRSAMGLEFYDAGERFFDWCLKGDEGVSIEVMDLDEQSPLPFPLEFPIFAVLCSGAVQGNSSDRAQGLVRLIKMYHATSGNDAMRWTLIEGAALGASKYFGQVGDYDEALANVRIALHYAPKSIHLRAAEFALELRLAGKPVPARLEKFIGKDNGALADRMCPEPFRRFDVGPSGETLLCCGHWLPTPIGNIMTQEVDDVMNSPAAQKIRASMLDGSFRYCNHLECTALIQGYLPKKDSLIDPQLRRAVEQHELRIEKVDQMLFAFDQSCNLSCPSCRVERIIEKPAIRDAKTEVVSRKLEPLLKGMKRLDINPAGEVFSSKPSRRILELVNRQDCPDLVIDIISNGTLFTEKEWANLPNLNGMVRSVRISTDGATRPTFEKLRRLASWEVFTRNMEFLGRLRTSGEIKQLKMSFTYQVDNFREMKQFIEFGRSFNADFVIFERLQNLGAYSWDEFRSKAVHLSDHPLHREFLDVVCDPVFGQRMVWHDFEWEGIVKLNERDASVRMGNAVDSTQFVGAARHELR
jgi:hypothetical protein